MLEQTRSTFASWLYSVGQALYRGPIQTLLQESGGKHLFKTVLVRMMDGYTVEAGDTVAGFGVDTSPELFHLKNNSAAESEILQQFVSELHSDDVVFDIGANIGVYAVLAAKVTDGDVVAFEPAPYNVEKIEQNAFRNGVSVTTHQLALSDEDGEASFAMDARGVAGSGHGSLKEQTGISTTVQTRRGDSLIVDGEMPPPTAVKIDVEGAELDVIDGLENSLKDERCRLVYCEVHPSHVSFEAVAGRLEELGFEAEQGEVENRTHLRATR